MLTCQSCTGLGQLEAQAGVAWLLLVQGVLHLLEAHRSYLVGPISLRHHVYHCRQGIYSQRASKSRTLHFSLHRPVQTACVPTVAAKHAFQSSISTNQVAAQTCAPTPYCPSASRLRTQTGGPFADSYRAVPCPHLPLQCTSAAVTQPQLGEAVLSAPLLPLCHALPPATLGNVIAALMPVSNKKLSRG